MEDRVFHVVELAVQLLGIGILVFKGGKYIGTANGAFKTLFAAHEDLKKAQNAHQADDDAKHEKLSDGLSNVRVEVARMSAGSKN